MGGREVDISLIATFHRESYLAGWTLDNLSDLRREADGAGISHELICMLDRADDETASIVEGHAGLRDHDQVVRVDHGDLGLNRNEGVSRAHGEFVATFDGDDYYSRHWLTAAHRVLASGQRERVVLPAFLVSFGAQCHVFELPDQENVDVPDEALLTLHPWGSSVFVAKRAIEEWPYQSTRVEETGFAYEDWHWNLEMLARGYKFVTAPGTARYYRRRADSMLARQTKSNGIIRPNAFFRRRPNERSYEERKP